MDPTEWMAFQDTISWSDWLNQAKKSKTRQARTHRLIQLLEDGLGLKELK